MAENQQDKGFEGQGLSQGTGSIQGGQTTPGSSSGQVNFLEGDYPSFQQQPNVYQKPIKELNRVLWITLTALLALLIGLAGGSVFGWAWGRESASRAVYPKLQPSNEAVFHRNTIEGYWAGSESELDWDFEALEQLTFSDYTNPQGSLVEEVIDERGKASQVDMDWDSLRLTWRSQDSSKTIRSSVTATFDKEGGEYRLRYLSMDHLSVGSSKHTSSQDRMTEDYFNQLKVGEAKTGEGGTSYQDVLFEYGNTNSLSISWDSDSKKPVMKMYYYAGDRTYSLEFTQQDNKDFLLSKAEKK